LIGVARRIEDKEMATASLTKFNYVKPVFERKRENTLIFQAKLPFRKHTMTEEEASLLAELRAISARSATSRFKEDNEITSESSICSKLDQENLGGKVKDRSHNSELDSANNNQSSNQKENMITTPNMKLKSKVDNLSPSQPKGLQKYPQKTEFLESKCNFSDMKHKITTDNVANY
jgi:hypothetical protein